MNKKSQTSCRAAGFSLVEALVGTVILGGLLAGIVLAKGRLELQERRSRLRQQACEALDERLHTWWSDPRSIPRPAQGGFDNAPDLYWRTRLIASPETERWDLQRVAVEAFSPGHVEPLAAVEIVLPAPRTPPRGPAPEGGGAGGPAGPGGEKESAKP